MEKISLYNSETDTVMEIEVSVEDANRARNDVVFATELLNTALQQDVSVEHQIEATDDTDGDTNADTENSLYRWSTPCVLLYLETYRSMEERFHAGNCSQKKVWEDIAKIMNTRNYNVTGLQCAAKMRSLKKTYKSIKDHNNKSGNDRRNWQFFEIMDEIFSGKAWVSPVAVASSTGLSIQQHENSVEQEGAASSDSGCSTQVTSKSVKTLLTKRMCQKDEHEENRKRRHQERMEIDNKLLTLLESLIKK